MAITKPRKIPSNTAKYGSSVFVTCSIVILLIPQDTNNTEPTGGVILPIHMLKISITPNWIADIPRLSAIGRKIGVKIRIAGVISINIPITSRIMFIRRSRIYLLSVIAISPLLIAAGIPVLASKAVPTDQAIELAKKYRLNLICRAWPDRIEIYHDARK